MRILCLAKNLTADGVPTTEGNVSKHSMHQPVGGRGSIVTLEEVNTRISVRRFRTIPQHEVVVLIESRRNRQIFDNLGGSSRARSFKVAPVSNSRSRSELSHAFGTMIYPLSQKSYQWSARRQPQALAKVAEALAKLAAAAATGATTTTQSFL